MTKRFTIQTTLISLKYKKLKISRTEPDYFHKTKLCLKEHIFKSYRFLAEVTSRQLHVQC